MSFSRFTGEFSPLFRLLDDYASHSATRTGDSHGFGSAVAASALRSFTPKFDVKETKEAYELHGELPGIEQKNVNIEFTDSQTIQISGRTEHRRTRGEPPVGFIEGEQYQQNDNTTTAANDTHQYHKPTVEDDADKSSGTAMQKSGNGNVAKQQQGGGEDAGTRYWVSERSIGEFSRSFTFPGRVDQDKVKASLKNGILSIVVPKGSAPQARKIAIE